MVRAADAIMDQVERLILEGKVRPGQKLPSERALAEEFDVSRPTVREAIQKLEARGLVQRRHGGGTFVAEHVGSTFLDPMMAMIQRSPDGTFDIIELRFALESVAAWLAADRATERARGNVQRRYHELQVAVRSHDLHREARADAEFHLAIAEASQNGIILHIMRSIFVLLEESIVRNLAELNLDRQRKQELALQHEAMYRAIVLDKDPMAARRAVRQHMLTISESLDRERASDTKSRRLRELTQSADLEGRLSPATPMR
ncbi:MAG: GntR family transcriptional regulator [Litorivicinaceae bacterium]|nr:GntR family transcriptional regulator [Litorivicinaceae bacterium]MDP5343088.1 GntR family transcriptional regulator [Litorivicinaceae bacterium]